MRKFILTPLIAILLSFGLTFNSTAQDLMITGVMDGPLTGGVPKAIELYVINDIADLSVYGLGSANNGGGTDGEEFTFPANTATAGDFIYIATETPQFNAWFGFDPDYTDGFAGINGDDAIELFQSGSVVDLFGVIDASPTTWGYTDGWAYRNADATPSTTFTDTDWTFSGADALDGETTNASATTPFPLGTFTMGGGGLAYPFSENFETWPLENWTIEGTSSYLWESNDGSSHGPGSAQEGSLSAMFNVYSASTGSTTTMTTEIIDMSGATNPILEFYFWMDGYSADANLWIKAEMTTDGSTWNEIFYHSYDGNAGWNLEQISLSGVNATTQIRITGASDWGSYNLFVDDLKLREVSTETDFIAYSFPEQLEAATINTGTHSIDIAVGNGTDLTNLTAEFTLSVGATATIGTTAQTSGVTTNNFSSPVTYSVTAEDGITVQPWTITVTEAAINTETDITAYSFPEQTSAITPDAGAHTVNIEVAWDTDITSLIADFELSYGASADVSGTTQTSGVTSNDFSAPVTYSITAEDGTTVQPWTVTVTKEPIPAGATCETAIDYGAVNDAPQAGSIVAYEAVWYYVTLTEDMEDVTFSLCNSTFDTKLEVWNDCGDATYEFYNDDNYTECGSNRSFITAGSLSAGTYYVKAYGYSSYFGDYELEILGREISSENDILNFTLAEQTGVATPDAGAHTVDIEVANGTDLTALTPTITVSDYASIFPASGVTRDFTNPVTYSVTAEDNTEQIWTVTVSEALTLSSENDILSFELTEQTAPITPDAGTHTVNIEVLWDTDVTSLTPTITVSPQATISPETGVAQDFTNPVTYTVTAEDATEQAWTVTVTKEPTPAGATCDAAIDYGMINDPAVNGTLAAGEGFWYTVTLDQDYANVVFSLCGADFDTRLAVFADCADHDGSYGNEIGANPDGAIAYDDDGCPGTIGDTYASVIDYGTLTAGTYYVVVYGWNSSSAGTYPLEITGSDCGTPTDVTVSNLTATGATITWTAGLNETAWNVKVSETSIDPTQSQTGLIFDGTVNTTPELDLATMLEELTDYYVYVQADCGADWTTELMFTTPAGCPQPANLTANVGIDFAELDWDAYGGTEWNIKISDASINPLTDAGNIEEVNATSTKPYTTSVTLDPNTTYYFYVQSSCGSDWSEEGTFTTDCAIVTTFPYVEDFEDGALPDCWLQGTDNPEDWKFTNNPGAQHIGNNGAISSSTNSDGFMAYVDDSSPNSLGVELLSPMFDVSSLSNPQLDFFLISNNEGYDNVEFSVDIWDGAAWNEDAFFSNSNTENGEWENIIINLNSFTITGPIQIRFVVDDTNTDWYDDVAIDDISIRDINTEADFLSYSFPEQTSAADINYTAYTIDVEVGNGTDLTSLVADYTVSTGASVSIGTTAQESGVTINDFSSPVTYTVTSEDGATVNNWVVTVNEAAILTETDFISYTFPEATNTASIDTDAKTIEIEVAWDADLTTLVAEYELSYGATAAIAGTDQESGVTANDFTNPVVYTVTAEDMTTTADWTVTVTVQATPAGATCETAFNYGFVNDPAQTGTIESYGSEWYFVTLDQNMIDVTFSLCGSSFDTKIEIWEDCGDASYLYYNDDACGTQSEIVADQLDAGVYYVKVYGYGSASGDYELIITGTTDYITPYVDNTTLTLTPETQNVATGDDATGVMEVVYPTTVSTDMPADMMTDAMLDVSELTAGSVIELFDGAMSLGTYTVTGGETVWASEAFTSVNRVAATMTEGQSLNWDVVISGLANGTYNVSATLYLGLDADLTAETNMTEVATDAMVINVAAPFIDLALISPEGGMYDCGLEDPVNVPVEIENVGNTTIATGEIITFYVDVDGTNEIEEEITLAEDLLPGETLSMETTSTLDFTALGTYNWEAIIDYTGDTDPNNNFTTGYLVHFNQDIEFVGAVNDTITIDATDWPYTIETNLTLSTDSVLVSTYEWEFDGSTETSLTINDEGWYILHVTTEYCETMDSVFVLAYNGIDVNANNEFAIYPNPTHGQFMLEMNLVEKQDVVISIFNSNGQLVREFKFDDIDQFAREINMTDEAEGLYSIRINAGGKLYNRQVVIR